MDDFGIDLYALQAKYEKEKEKNHQKAAVKINRINQKIGKYKSALATIERRERTHRLIQIGAMVTNAFAIDPLSIEPEEFQKFIQNTKRIALPFPEKYTNGQRQLFWYDLNKAWDVFQQNREKEQQ